MCLNLRGSYSFAGFMFDFASVISFHVEEFEFAHQGRTTREQSERHGDAKHYHVLCACVAGAAIRRELSPPWLYLNPGQL